MYLGTTALLVLSIIISCFVRYVAPGIIFFILAVAGYIVSSKLDDKVMESVKEEAPLLP